MILKQKTPGCLTYFNPSVTRRCASLVWKFIIRAVFHTAFQSVVIFLFFVTVAGYAQDKANESGVPITIEIQNLEKTIAIKGINPAERHDALVRLARLRQLSGDIEGAAKNWLEAAAAIPGKVDDDALLACAFCLAAMGEWERACAALEPLLPKSARARFLDISISAWRNGDIKALAGLADSIEYSQMKSEIYFMLWKIQGTRGEASIHDSWKQRLLSEFPQSPEARLAESEANSVAIKPSPFWLFLHGRETMIQMENASSAQQSSLPAATTPVPQASTPPQAAPAQSLAPQPAPAPQAQAVVPAPAARPESVRLQTGVFSREANAHTQIDKLKKAGFSPSLEKRLVNGNEMWAVIVPAQDASRVTAELRAAGFDSFQVR